MEEGRTNYHWAESDISVWAGDKIGKALDSRGYVIREMNADVKICQRMNTLGLVYMISFECIKDGKHCGIRDFYSTSEKADGMEDFEWFPDFFMEMEVEAILKFGNRVLDTGKGVERTFSVRNINVPESKTVDIIYKTNINCSLDEIKSFVLSSEFISAWSGNRAVFDGNDVVLDNTIIHNLREDGGSIRMGWKFSGWNEYSNVKMTFETLPSSIKVMVTQKRVPIKEAESVKVWWHEGMFIPISACFGFALRPVE